MDQYLSFISLGIVLGLTAGISPGPLLTLVISETIMYGRKEGIKIAIAPILSDLPIILLCLFLLSQIPEQSSIIGIISFSGATFLLYLAYKHITYSNTSIKLEKSKPYSFKKGFIANLLNPHPYIFWFTLGPAILNKALQVNTGAAIIFFGLFYICLVGSKILVSILVEKSKQFLQNKIYIYIIRFLGLILVLFAIYFIREGLNLLDITIKYFLCIM